MTYMVIIASIAEEDNTACSGSKVEGFGDRHRLQRRDGRPKIS